MSEKTFFFSASTHKPHTSVVIDVYRVSDGRDCTAHPAEKIVFGIQGCEKCLQNAVAQLIATDTKFATFVSECLYRAGASFPLEKINSESAVWVTIDALRQCERALADCYEVCCYPADGSTAQDSALRRAKGVIDHIINLKHETRNTGTTGGDSGTEKIG